MPFFQICGFQSLQCFMAMFGFNFFVASSVPALSLNLPETSNFHFKVSFLSLPNYRSPLFLSLIGSTRSLHRHLSFPPSSFSDVRFLIYLLTPPSSFPVALTRLLPISTSLFSLKNYLQRGSDKNKLLNLNFTAIKISGKAVTESCSCDISKALCF